MSEFNVEAYVARLERMGLKLSAVPMADGKLRINRWRMMQAAENTQQIQDLWASQIGDNQARIDMLGAHLAAQRGRLAGTERYRSASRRRLRTVRLWM